MKNREKGEKRMQKFLRRLERFSQSLLSPLSYLSAAGLLLVLGALLTSKPLCQALPVLQWAPLQLMGQLLYNGMMVLINNLSALRSVGGSYAVPADRVKSAVKKYFGRELTPSATKRFPFKDGCFIAPQASGEAYKFAQIVDMTPAGGGLFKATVKLYTASSGFTGDSHGTPQQWRKSSTEDVPAESGVVRALISRSRIEPGRYFLRAYQQAR